MNHLPPVDQYFSREAAYLHGPVFGRCVEWLRGEPSDHAALFILKQVIRVTALALLVFLVVTIPIYHRFLEEWNYQLKRDVQVYSVFSGAQGICNGVTEKEKARVILENLMVKSPDGIFFGESGITGRVEGGNCSAMSLDFAGRFLSIPDESSQALINRVKELEGFYNPGSVQEFRNRQEAYNCIRLDREREGVDFTSAKIQALANDRLLRVTGASRGFSWDNFNVLKREIDELPDGVHLFRMILPEDNEKGERQGHSMVLVKRKEGSLFYDPNLGAELIVKNVSKRVFHHLKRNHSLFQLTQARFYTLINDGSRHHFFQDVV